MGIESQMEPEARLYRTLRAIVRTWGLILHKAGLHWEVLSEE